MFKVINKNTRTTSHLFLVFLLLTLNKQMLAGFMVCFELIQHMIQHINQVLQDVTCQNSPQKASVKVTLSQPAITCSKLTIETTLEQGVKYIKKLTVKVPERRQWRLSSCLKKNGLLKVCDRYFQTMIRLNSSRDGLYK